MQFKDNELQVQHLKGKLKLISATTAPVNLGQTDWSDDESDDDPNINFVINEEPNQESEQPLSQVFESKQQKSPEKISNVDEESNGYEW